MELTSPSATAQSKSPSPEKTSIVAPIIEISVIKNLLLNKNTFLKLDLYLKLSLFQIKGIFSSKVRLPIGGDFGKSNVAGRFFVTFNPVNKVTKNVVTIYTEIIITYL